MLKRIVLIMGMLMICVSILPEKAEAGWGGGVSIGGSSGPPKYGYSICMEKDFMGETSIKMMEKPEAQKRLLEIKEANKILQKAVPLAMKEWEEKHKDTKFPARSVSPNNFKILCNIADKKKAEESLKKYQEQLEEQNEKKLKLEENRAKTLTEEQKKKLAELHELEIEAFSLIKTKCAEVKKKIEEQEKKKEEKNGKLGLNLKSK